MEGSSERRRLSLQLTTLPPSAISEKRLANLFELDYFLSAVLGQLIDDGLHECRLVCRKWNEVCKAMPVKLTVPLEKVPQAVKEFPNAVRLTTVYRPQRRNNRDPNGQETSLDEILFEEPSKLKCLQEMKVQCSLRSDEAFPGLVGKYFAFMAQLQSLELLINRSDVATYSHIRHLTNLTHLKMRLGHPAGVFVKPFSELCKIQKLSVDQLMVNERGELMFPSLNNLTDLEIVETSKSIKKWKDGVLKEILPFSTSLQSFAWRVNCEQHPRCQIDWSLLPRFASLTSISIDDVTGAEERSFCAGLREMPNLTQLSCDYWSGPMEPLLSSFRWPRRLRSLTIRRNSNWPALQIPNMMTSFNQLTRLEVENYKLGSSLSGLTTLVELVLSIGFNQVDLSTTLSKMKFLESLQISGYGNQYLPSGVISDLNRLKKLSLCSIRVDNNFLYTLGWLRGLTELRLDHCVGLRSSMTPHLRRLRSLEHLTFDRTLLRNPSNFLLNAIPSNLKYLKTDVHLSDWDKVVLMKQFPKLRGVK